MTLKSVNKKRSYSYDEWTELNAQYLLYLMKQTDLSRKTVEENENIHMGASNCASLIRSSSSRKRTKRTRETEAMQHVEEHCYGRINCFEPCPTISVSTTSSSPQDDDTLSFVLGGEGGNESFLWQEEMDGPVQTSAGDSPTILHSQTNMVGSGGKNNVDFPAQTLETAFDREDLSCPLESTSEGITMMSSKEKQLLLEIVNEV